MDFGTSEFDRRLFRQGVNNGSLISLDGKSTLLLLEYKLC